MSFPLTRRSALLGAAAMAAPQPLLAADDREDVLRALQAFVFGTSTDIPAAIELLRSRGRPDVVSGLIFVLRYTRYPRDAVLDLLEDVAGVSPGRSWSDWMLWLEGQRELRSHPAYYELKRTYFMTIDSRWRPFLEPRFIAEGAMDIRFEEVVWGGVRRYGIPSLDFPTLIEADEADYLRGEDLVFGVEIDGDARAYPLRIMGWHEMFNEVIGGVPVALAYCTLCGAGILFETSVEGFDAPMVMGTSGFLYRSNKLMYDRATESLWNQFTGEPVSGELRGSGIRLRQRPVVIEPWAEWRRRNQGTRVLSVNTGFERDYGSGVVYRDYFASPELMFPARVDQTRLAQKDYVFAIRRFAASRAWALHLFEGGALINDAVGDLPIVLVAARTGRPARPYERRARHVLRASPGPRSAGGGVRPSPGRRLARARGRAGGVGGARGAAGRGRGSDVEARRRIGGPARGRCCGAGGACPGCAAAGPRRVRSRPAADASGCRTRAVRRKRVRR